MKCYIYPYKMGSRSAKALAKGITALRLRRKGAYRPRASHIIINWGTSELPLWDWRVPRWLNHPKNVQSATSKLSFLRHMESKDFKNIPPFTTNTDTANEWLRKGYRVIARTLLRGRAGHGIEVFEKDDTIPSNFAPLYTQYLSRRIEYRVHVMNGKVFDFAQKKRTYTVSDEDVNWTVRTYENGWIYARESVDLPERAKLIAETAMINSELDFGAVDLVHNLADEDFYVLEVNTAPGLEGLTIARYIESFNAEYNI
jgi:hypothetical protein